RPATVIFTPVWSRTTSSPHPRAVASASRATASSEPLTEGVATSSVRSSISVAELAAKIGRLLLAADDHGTAAGAGEDLEQQRVGLAAVDDVRALDSAGGCADARLHLRPHAAGDRAAREQGGEVVGIGEGNE